MLKSLLEMNEDKLLKVKRYDNSSTATNGDKAKKNTLWFASHCIEHFYFDFK